MKHLLFLLLSFSLYAAGGIEGFWKTINEDGVAQSVIAIYEYGGLYYGRIIATFDESGKFSDSIYNPQKRAPGVVGERYYSGLDIIWFLRNRGIKFKGKILDPQKGDIYNSEVWTENGNLVVRGKLMMFGRSQTWLPMLPADFPKGFKIPDLKSFVPDIPEVK